MDSEICYQVPPAPGWVHGGLPAAAAGRGDAPQQAASSDYPGIAPGRRMKVGRVTSLARCSGYCEHSLLTVGSDPLVRVKRV